MKLKLIIESRLPDELLHIIKSIGFFNEQGVDIYEKNKAGTMGNKFTQEEAKKLTFENFIFNLLLSDLKTFSQSESKQYWPEGFKYGKSGSHIWVCNASNDRVLLIHF